MTRSVRIRRLALLALSLTAACGRAPAEESASETYLGYSTRPRPSVEQLETGDPTAIDAVSRIAAGPAEPTFVPPEAVLPPAVPPPTYGGGMRTTAESLYYWQMLPSGVLFRSFIAGDREPRMGAELVHDERLGTLIDAALGSRMSILRYGTDGPNAEGFEIQIAGAAFPRLAMDREMDVEATDYRIGVPLVYRRGPTAFRFGYDHISSHAGDEFLLKNPGFPRINYVRDSLLFAVAHDVTDALLVYGEVGYAFNTDGGAEPWEFQFGAEFAPPPDPGFRGGPVAAVNTHLREEFDFDGNLSIVAGWQWRGISTDQLLRLGLTYYTGNSRQYSFLTYNETLTGIGLWYDF